MGGDMRIDRMNWIEHYHACPDCQCHQPCQTGLYLIRAMAGSMTRDENLPEWMSGLVH